MYKIFGGRSEYLKTPAAEVQRHSLCLMAKWMAEKELNEEAERKNSL